MQRGEFIAEATAQVVEPCQVLAMWRVGQRYMPTSCLLDGRLRARVSHRIAMCLGAAARLQVALPSPAVDVPRRWDPLPPDQAGFSLAARPHGPPGIVA